MKALVVHGPKNVTVEELSVPNFGEDELLIKVCYCGICGSDLPRALEGKAHFYPIILGHEFSGVIEKVNPQSKFKRGDRVVVAPLLPCEKCEFCQLGKPMMCANYGFIGSRENGAMAEYISVKEKNVLNLPDSIRLEEAALIEPLTVAIHGIDRVKITNGGSATIFGAGTIGLLTLQCLLAKGVTDIHVIDIADAKLELAKSMGATEVINAQNTDVIQYFIKNGRPQYVFETAGTPITQEQAVAIVKNLGKVVFIGTATSDVPLAAKSFERILRGELEITGSWMSYSAPFPGYEWRTAIEYIKQKKVDVSPFLKNIIPLSHGLQAFLELQDSNKHNIKIMFKL